MIEPTWQSECGSVKLWLGDCLDVMRSWPEKAVDAVVTDPPYGINHESHGMLFSGHQTISGDDSLETASAIRVESKRMGVACAMFYSPYAPLSGWRNVLAWDKGGHVGIGGDRATCWKRTLELIGVENNGPLTGDRESAVLKYNAVSPPSFGHAHQKPLELMSYLIQKLGAFDVADPCMGSGTTGVAAVRLGRKFWGVEIDPGYFEIAKRRIQDELARVKFLEPERVARQAELFAMEGAQ